MVDKPLSSDEFSRFARQIDEGLSGKAMLAAVMAEWGGLGEYARELRADYEELPIGHPGRLKLQTLIMQAVLKLGQTGDVGEFEEEIMEEARENYERQLEAIQNKSRDNGNGDGLTGRTDQNAD